MNYNSSGCWNRALNVIHIHYYGGSFELETNFPFLDDLADDLGDVDFDDPANPENDNEGWETEDEMEAEAEQDDSELTFSKHTGTAILQVCATAVWQKAETQSCSPCAQALCSVWVWIQPQTA